MMYERLQSLVSYASYQKATSVNQGGKCCMPDCDEDTRPEIGGYMCSETGHVHKELEGFEPICPSCEIMLTEHAPEELTQWAPCTRIHYIRRSGEVVGVAEDNDDDLPF